MITVEKSPVPIIWLDTSIIINMTQYRVGAKLQETQKKRIRSLYRTILKATRKGKLICPLANQDEEVWVKRNLWLKTIHELSLGISTKSLLGIKENQFRLCAEAFLRNEDSIQVSYSDLFLGDPIEELNEALSGPMYVAINPPLIGGGDYQRDLYDNMRNQLNVIREENVANIVTFEQQLEKEHMAELDVIIHFLTTHPNEGADEYEQMNDLFGRINAISTIRDWNTLREENNRNDVTLEDFFRSNFYREMPMQKLQAEFHAMLMTDKQPIRSGDMKDIEHISTVLPFVDMFITDKQRRTQLCKMGSDDLYDTKICYIGDQKNY